MSVYSPIRITEWKWLPRLGLSVNTGAPDWITSLVRVTQERLDETLGLIGGHPGFGFSAAMGAFTVRAEPIATLGVTEYPEGR